MNIYLIQRMCKSLLYIFGAGIVYQLNYNIIIMFRAICMICNKNKFYVVWRVALTCVVV